MPVRDLKSSESPFPLAVLAAEHSSTRYRLSSLDVETYFLSDSYHLNWLVFSESHDMFICRFCKCEPPASSGLCLVGFVLVHGGAHHELWPRFTSSQLVIARA